MSKIDPVEQIMQTLELEMPEDLSDKFHHAIEPYLPEIQQVLSDCRAFMEHYQLLVQQDQLHPESAGDLMRYSDLLRFHLIEPHSVVESLTVIAEYVALQRSDMKTVELKRKQAEAWVQPFKRLQRILKEYGEWLDRVGYTLREIHRRRD